MHVAFIGLGNMGGSMAVNMAKAGSSLYIYDISKKNVDDVLERGKKFKMSNLNNITDLNKIDDISTIILMLPSSKETTHVICSDQGILKDLKPNSLIIDCTTGDINVAKEVGSLVRKKQSSYVDAPVSGGINGAKNGTLTFMVGADQRDSPKIKPVLESMGKNIFFCGDTGLGLAAKICNNMMLAISMIGFSETLELARRLGLDLKAISSIVNASSGKSWASDVYNPVPGVMENVPASNDYNGGFQDLALALDSSNRVKSPTPLGSLAFQMYNLMNQSGLDKKDFSIIYKYLQGQKASREN